MPDGLPVADFMVCNIINANAAPGRLAIYGGMSGHRARTGCTLELEVPERMDCPAS